MPFLYIHIILRGHYSLDQCLRISRASMPSYRFAIASIRLFILTTTNLDLLIWRMDPIRFRGLNLSHFILILSPIIISLSTLSILTLLHFFRKALRVHSTFLHRHNPMRLCLIHMILRLIMTIISCRSTRRSTRVLMTTSLRHEGALLLLQERAGYSILTSRTDQLDDSTAHPSFSGELHRIQHWLFLLLCCWMVRELTAPLLQGVGSHMTSVGLRVRFS